MSVIVPSVTVAAVHLLCFLQQQEAVAQVDHLVVEGAAADRPYLEEVAVVVVEEEASRGLILRVMFSIRVYRDRS